MNASPLISIIVPTRDRPALLQRALASILAQTMQRIEIIVLDDASGEQTRADYAQLTELHDVRIKLHLLGRDGQHGIGPAAVRNIGLQQASADIVAFLDDDDAWSAPQHLDNVMQAFAAQPTIDAYIGNQIAVLADGTTSASSWLPALSALIAGRTASGNCHVLSPAELTQAQGFAHLNIFVLRKRIAEQIGGFWERTNYEEDRDFFWRSIDSCRAVAFNPAIIAQHNVPDRSKQNNVTTRYSMVDRWLVSLLVSQHIQCNVSHREIATMSRHYEGDIARHLSHHFRADKKPALAFAYAKRALATRYSSKWLLYTAYLMATTFKTAQRD